MKHRSVSQSVSQLIFIFILPEIIMGIYIFHVATSPISLLQRNPPSTIEYCGEVRGPIVQINKGDSLDGQLRKLSVSNNTINFYIAKALWKVFYFNETIKVGQYQIDPDGSLLSFFSDISKGDQVYFKFTIIPGINLKEVIASINQNSIFTKKIDVNEINSMFEDESLEGRILPDSYCMPYPADPVSLIKQSNMKLHSFIDELLKKYSYSKIISNKNSLLTLASIIEKEASLVEERKLISAVYLNRLKIGMKLQADPTVIYGMGDAYAGNIRKKDLLTKTPYNTYTNYGLPPGPIAMSTRETIESVFNPADVTYLFFVAKKDAIQSHAFSNTYKEHKQYVEKYQLNR